MTRAPACGSLARLALVLAACRWPLPLASWSRPASSCRAGEAWAHLAATVLPGYVGTTLVLLAAVLVGRRRGRRGHRLAGRRPASFPGRRVLEWALLLPLAVPAYVMAYAYTDWLQFSGPVQTWLRAVTGWGRGDYWFPEIRSLGGAARDVRRACSIRTSTCSRAWPSSSSRRASPRPGARWASRRARAFFRVSLPMARPAIAAGAALALMETLADFGTVSYFGVQTFTTGIFRAWLSMGEPVVGGASSR